jgi:hypothetical protein
LRYFFIAKPDKYVLFNSHPTLSKRILLLEPAGGHLPEINHHPAPGSIFTENLYLQKFSPKTYALKV